MIRASIIVIDRYNWTFPIKLGSGVRGMIASLEENVIINIFGLGRLEVVRIRHRGIHGGIHYTIECQWLCDAWDFNYE